VSNPVARRGDSSSHGGAIVTSALHTSVEGAKVAIVGSILACPIHGAQPIVSGCPIWKVEGQPVARTGSTAACGAVIIGGAQHMKVP
jgi:uncharacterized Zn-binding protein involved in type VI secretion